MENETHNEAWTELTHRSRALDSEVMRLKAGISDMEAELAQMQGVRLRRGDIEKVKALLASTRDRLAETQKTRSELDREDATRKRRRTEIEHELGGPLRRLAADELLGMEPAEGPDRRRWLDEVTILLEAAVHRAELAVATQPVGQAHEVVLETARLLHKVASLDPLAQPVDRREETARAWTSLAASLAPLLAREGLPPLDVYFARR